MPDWIASFLFGTVWGIGLLCSPLIGLLFLASKMWPQHSTIYFAVMAIILFGAIATVPSIPRYQFEQEVVAELEKNPYARVVHKFRLGEITEPLTWFNAPYGSFFVVIPDRLTGMNDNLDIPRSFQTVLLRYDEPIVVSMMMVYCADREYKRSEPDQEGYFRNTTATAQELNDELYSIYCEYDWPEFLRKTSKSES